MVSEARKKYLASMTPAQRAEHIANVEGYTSAAQKAAAGGSPPSVKTITVSPEQEHAWGLGGATYAQQQAAARYMGTPQGQANAGAIYGQQDYLQQQQQMMQQPQTPVSIGTSGMVTPYQDPGLWEKTKAATQDIYGYLRHPETLGAQMQQLPIENAPPPLGYQALGLGAALLEPGIGGAEIKAGEKVAVMTARELKLNLRALGLNPRALANMGIKEAEALSVKIRALVKDSSNFAKEGSKLLTPGGEKIIAQTVTPKATKAIGEIATDTKKQSIALSLIKKHGVTTALSLTNIGILIKLTSSDISISKQVTDYTDDVGDVATELSEAGFNQQVEEMMEGIDQLQTFSDSWKALIPGLGNKWFEDMIAPYQRKLDETVNKWEDQKAALKKEEEEVNFKILNGEQVPDDVLQRVAQRDQKGAAALYYFSKTDMEKEQAALETQGRMIAKMMSMADEQIIRDQEIILAVNDPANQDSLIVRWYLDARQRIIDKQRLAEQRAYSEKMTAEARAYAESRETEQREYTEATTEDSGGSALAFGGGNW